MLLGLAAVLLLALAAFLLWPRPAEPARPNATNANAPGRVVAFPPAVDLGRVPFDRMVEARYELTNTGGREVRLLDRPNVATLEGC